MSERILDILSTYNLQTQHDMIMLNSLLSAKTEFLRRKRRQHLRNIAVLQEAQFTVLKKLLVTNCPRRIWSKIRCSQFWEKEVSQSDEEFFKENFRMFPATFDFLCAELRSLHKINTNFRKSIPLQKRIAIALYTIGSTAEYKAIGNLFGVGKSTVCNILKRFCLEVWKVLQPKYLNGEHSKSNYIEEIEKSNESEILENSLLKRESESSLDQIKVENSFRYLKARFRRVGKEQDNKASNNFLTIRASCVLYNFLNFHNDIINNNWLQQEFEIQENINLDLIPKINATSSYLVLLDVPDVSEDEAMSDKVGVRGFSGLGGGSKNV